MGIVLRYNYYRYRQIRKNLKTLIESSSFVEARDLLISAIAEFEAAHPNIMNDYSFQRGEYHTLKHALEHINAIIDHGDPVRIIDELGNTESQSERLKNRILEFVPHADYSSIISPSQ